MPDSTKPSEDIGRVWKLLGRHDERLNSLERWRDKSEERGLRIGMILLGGVVAGVATVIAAVILLGLGVS